MSVLLSTLFVQHQAVLREKCANKVRDLHPDWSLDRVAQTVEKVVQSMASSCLPGATVNSDPEMTQIGLEIISDRDLSEEEFKDIQKCDVENIKRLVSDVPDGIKIPLIKCMGILEGSVQATVQKCHAVGCNVAKKLQKCMGCEAVFYCSKEHQRKDWKGHRPDCEPIRNWKQISQEFGQIGSDLFS